MSAERKRKSTQKKSNKLERRHQEDALDDALENTFPASDPVSIEQPTTSEADYRER
jgi:hypothetical protein